MDKNMADRLIELREKNHLSQSAVANRLGVTPALISAYEKTERNPSLERLIALADIYHTSTDYILGRTTTDSYATIIEIKDLISCVFYSYPFYLCDLYSVPSSSGLFHLVPAPSAKEPLCGHRAGHTPDPPGFFGLQNASWKR